MLRFPVAPGAVRRKAELGGSRQHTQLFLIRDAVTN